MKIIRNSNGISIKVCKGFRLWKTFNLYNDSKRNFLFQFNRFENGYCTIYLRLFKRYSLSITDIKVSEGKRVFIGNKELC